ncbi:MAG: type II toxin-antitoxin system HigB family toxin [Deltaproteobacteria bacterium]|nr:type II toxin-antitoxin system HigB family toxin [Deltaproteobacteria bacterium]
MRIIAKSRIIEYGKKYGPDAQDQLDSWYQEAKAANWHTPQEIVKLYKGADAVGKETIIFNICHNRYRLIVNVSFSEQIVFIKFFGTHAEYNKFDLKTIRNEGKSHENKK